MECGSNATALAHTARRRAVYLQSSPETPAPPEVKAAALLPHSIVARRSTICGMKLDFVMIFDEYDASRGW